jgi:ribosomal protein L34E
MLDFNILESIQRCGICGVYHHSIMRCDADAVEDMPFCELHPDTQVEYRDLPFGGSQKHCSECHKEAMRQSAENSAKPGGGLSVSEQSDMYEDYRRGL